MHQDCKLNQKTGNSGIPGFWRELWAHAGNLKSPSGSFGLTLHLEGRIEYSEFELLHPSKLELPM